MKPVRLEPAASHSQVKHSTTEPLHSLKKSVAIIYYLGDKMVLYLIFNCINDFAGV